MSATTNRERRDFSAARRRPFVMARHVLAEWLSHLVAAAVLLSGFHSLEALLGRLGLYDRASAAAAVFDAGDAGLILGFLAFGVCSVLRAYDPEPDAEPASLAEGLRACPLALCLAAALQPPPPAFTIGGFVNRLTGHVLVYAGILVISIYLGLFALAPWLVALASLVVLLLSAIGGIAALAPRGSLRAKARWLVEIRIAAGSFAAGFTLLLLLEEFLRRSS